MFDKKTQVMRILIYSQIAKNKNKLYLFKHRTYNKNLAIHFIFLEIFNEKFKYVKNTVMKNAI